MSQSRSTILQRQIAKASAVVAALREQHERNRTAEDELRIEDRAMSAQAHAQSRPDTGRSERQARIRAAHRIAVASNELLDDAERAMHRLILQASGKRSRRKPFAAGVTS